MTKIYTRSGDKGLTGLYGGKRLPKSDLRIEAYGTVDEINSYLGLISAYSLACIDKDFFQSVQSNLFNVGALLAAVPEKRSELPAITDRDIADMENAIDELDKDLEALSYFILPGGSVESGHMQVARTVCRRAERLVVALHQVEAVDENIIRYLNRLSDFLFVLARAAMKEQGIKEIPWKS